MLNRPNEMLSENISTNKQVRRWCLISLDQPWHHVICVLLYFWKGSIRPTRSDKEVEKVHQKHYIHIERSMIRWAVRKNGPSAWPPVTIPCCLLLHKNKKEKKNVWVWTALMGVSLVVVILNNRIRNCEFIQTKQQVQSVLKNNNNNNTKES